jgi:hypothetical protein
VNEETMVIKPKTTKVALKLELTSVKTSERLNPLKIMELRDIPKLMDNC